jgi:hypothetical protein
MESDTPTHQSDASPSPSAAVGAVWLAALQAADRAIAAAAAVRALPSAELQRARARLAADRVWFASAGLA